MIYYAEAQDESISLRRCWVSHWWPPHGV